MDIKGKIFVVLKVIGLVLLYLPIWITGAMAVAGKMPDSPAGPALIDENLGLLFLSVINTVLIVRIINASRWRGWWLALFLGVAYYGTFTFLPQLETWYYLSDSLPSPTLLPGLFIMGLPVPFIFIPLAIKIMRHWQPLKPKPEPKKAVILQKDHLLKLALLAVMYVFIYWLAGYYIAWQNPDLRAYYGSPGEITPFFAHTIASLRGTPDLFLLQLGRGVVFVLVANPIIFGSNVGFWLTAILVGLLFAVPNLGLILPNPLMPDASVRYSHLIETITSNFLFGVIVTWLLHRKP